MDVALEVDHIIGFDGRCGFSLVDDSRKAIFCSGNCAATCSLTDPHEEQFFFRGHSSSLQLFATSPNQTYMATAASNPDEPDVLIWNVKERTLLYRFEEHLQGISCLAFSDDERFLVTIGEDEKLIIWDMESGQIVALTSIKSRPNVVKWGGRVKDIKGRDTHKFLFATAGKRHVHIWHLDPITGEFTREECFTDKHNREYHCLDFSSNHLFLYAGSQSGDFTVFNTRKFTIKSLCSGVHGRINSISVDEDMGVLCGSEDGRIYAFELYNYDEDADSEMIYVDKGETQPLNAPITHVESYNGSLFASTAKVTNSVFESLFVY